jgi:hypothetical protein
MWTQNLPGRQCFDEWCKEKRRKRGQCCLANGKTEVLDTNYVDIQGGDVAPCKQFLKAIPNGTTVLMGTSDDGVTKLNDEAQGLLLN